LESASALSKMRIAEAAGLPIVKSWAAGHYVGFNSILPLIIGAGFALGPPVIGRYIEYAGVRAVWPLMALISGLSALALVLLYFVEEHRKNAI